MAFNGSITKYNASCYCIVNISILLCFFNKAYNVPIIFSSLVDMAKKQSRQEPLIVQTEQKCTPEFRDLTKRELQKFIDSSDRIEMDLPNVNLKIVEIECILDEAEKLGLTVRSVGTVS